MTPRKVNLVGQPFSEQDIEDLVRWLRPGAFHTQPTPQLTQGPLVREFEERFAKYIGRKYAVMVNSGSSALFAAYYAAYFTTKPRNPLRVVVPSVAWPTTVAPAVQLGWPIAVGIVGADWAYHPPHLEWLVSEFQPYVVTVVDVLGVPANRDQLLELRERHGFCLIEDCCGAHGSSWKGQRVGSFGDLACFSFHVNHAVTTVEGGIVLTDDLVLAEHLRMIRAHGWAVDLGPERMAVRAYRERVEPFRQKFTFHVPGMNLRSTDLQARIGLSQLDRIDDIVARRARNDLIYRRLLKKIPGVETQFVSIDGFVSSIAVGVLVPNRARVVASLADAGVETRPIGGGNMRRQPFMRYANVFRDQPPDVRADAVHNRGLQLPNHPDLTEEDIEYVVEAVRKGVEG